MVRLLIANSHSKIDFSKVDTNSKKDIIKLLKEKFTVYNSALQRDPRVVRGIMSAEHCFYDAIAELLPTGLIPHLRLYLKQANIEHEVVEYRKFPKLDEITMNDINNNKLSVGRITARDYQLEALRNISKYRCGIIESATGSGKSFIIAGVCRLYKTVPILILFNRTSLMFQTRDGLINDYGFNESEIGTVGGSTYNDEARITLMTVQSYQNVFHLFPRVKVIITDEAHETGRSPTAEKVIYSCQNAPIRVGFSATVSTIENPYERIKLYGNVGPVIYKLPYDILRDSNVLADVKVSMYKIGTPGSIKITGIWNDSYDTVIINENEIPSYEGLGYEINKIGRDIIAKKLTRIGDESNLYTYNKERNELIASICNSKERVLVLYGKLAHGDELAKLLPNAMLISGKHDEKTRNSAKSFLKNEINSVVLASSIFDVGVDIPSIKTLVLAGSSVSTVRILQKVGRGTRKDAITFKDDVELIDFMQYDNALSLKQSKKRKRVYEELLKVSVTEI
jgi:superfamily II DNA or RNA helicase